MEFYWLDWLLKGELRILPGQNKILAVKLFLHQIKVIDLMISQNLACFIGSSCLQGLVKGTLSDEVHSAPLSLYLGVTMDGLMREFNFSFAETYAY